MTIKDLKPANVWNNFYLLTRQPRPSKHEEKVRAFLKEVTEKHQGYVYIYDVLTGEYDE